MGAAKSPPSAWEWSYADRNRNDHPWGNTPDPTVRATSIEDADSITNAFSCISLAPANQSRSSTAAVNSTNPLLTTSAPSSSSSISLSLSSDPRTNITSRSVSEEALRATLGATTNARISPFQPSPVADIDRAPSPVSLRPHPGPQAFDAPRFHQSRHVSLDNIQLAGLNLPHHPLAHPHSSVPQQPNAVHHQMPLSAHPSASMNFPQPYHSDTALPVHALGFGSGFTHQSQNQNQNHNLIQQPAANEFTNPLLPALGDAAQPCARKARSGKAKIKNELYKTEICRSYLMNNGYCKYGAKCQFAHGDGERRPVRRHPRYKTKLCRNYVTTGSCPYGTRCRFIHACDLGQDENTSHLNFMIAASREAVSMYPSANSSVPSQNAVSSSDSHSSTSPGSSNRLSSDLYGTTSIPETENLFAVHQNVLNSRTNKTCLPSTTPLNNVRSVIGAGRTSPIRPFSLGRDNAVTGIVDTHSNSPISTGSQTRSRLPVFRTLSGGVGTRTADKAMAEPFDMS